MTADPTAVWLDAYLARRTLLGVSITELARAFAAEHDTPTDQAAHSVLGAALRERGWVPRRLHVRGERPRMYFPPTREPGFPKVT